ncbi:MAG: sulfite exporter TauE/SafE family protein [Rhodobacteraceae bacterium]|nr:MAG: sulfite exporter TauE/SafE family protein [Paracoccaceae bacterium]
MSFFTPDVLLSAVLLAAAGCFAGLLSGLFGIGGGAVLVPILVATFTLQNLLPEHIAHMAVGTSLAIIIPTAIRSYLSHRKHGAGNATLLRSWFFWAPFGVIAASSVVGFVPGIILKYVFAAVALLIAFKMLFNQKNWVITQELPGPAINKGVGFGIGFLSTFMGIGGGNLNNLFMTLFGQSMHQAVATSAGLGVLIAIPATLGYVYAGWEAEGLPVWVFGYVNLLAVALIAPFSMLMAPFGAKLAHRLPARRLEIGFGLFLVCVIISFIV